MGALDYSKSNAHLNHGPCPAIAPRADVVEDPVLECIGCPPASQELGLQSVRFGAPAIRFNSTIHCRLKASVPDSTDDGTKERVVLGAIAPVQEVVSV